MSEQEKRPKREQKEATGRRDFLRRSGKILSYSVPVIYSLHSTRLKAQQMSAGSAAGSVHDVSQSLVTTLKDLPNK